MKQDQIYYKVNKTQNTEKKVSILKNAYTDWNTMEDHKLLML